jgi:hypothetical protein
MKAIVRFHKSLIASAIGLFVFLAFWSLRIAAPPRPALAAISALAAVGLVAYYFGVVRRKYG